MLKQINISRGVQVAMFNLVIVGAIGCILRYTFLRPISGVNYGYVLHAHSHLAFLGWVFMALFVLLVSAYLPTDALKKRKYVVLFIILQLANLGMLVTFPIMGYAAWSIGFSTIHAVAAVIFAWKFAKEVQARQEKKTVISSRFIKWALILMFVSNLAPMALGPVAALQGKSDLYYSIIYFYLHFQYNGWFTFALLGLVLQQLERRGVNTQSKLIKTGLTLKLLAIFPAYVLSVLWSEPNLVWYFIGGLAALIQLIGLICILYFIVREIVYLQLANSLAQRILFWMGIIAVGIQHLLMLLSSVPSLNNLAFSRNIVIAYLHLVLIGFVTVWLIYLCLKQGFVKGGTVTHIGLSFFLLAFFATELILVFQVHITEASRWLFYLAITQLCGILCIAVNTIKIDRHVKELSY